MLDVLKYLQLNWLDPYKEKFVTAWTGTHLNFGQTTTNRVESQHRDFKRYLKSANNSLHTLVEYVDKIVIRQETQIKHAFETSLIKTMEDHRLPIFDFLRGNVSHAALDYLSLENFKISKIKSANVSCKCRLWTSCGLPCACQLMRYHATGIIHFSRFNKCGIS